jgi:hypothetical protein
MKQNATTPTAATKTGQSPVTDKAALKAIAEIRTETNFAKAMIELLTDLGGDGNDSREGLFARERLYFDGIRYIADRFDAISNELEALQGGAA